VNAAKIVAMAILASALIQKSGLTYFYSTSGQLQQFQVDRLRTLVDSLSNE